jgi:hypothetical protein
MSALATVCAGEFESDVNSFGLFMKLGRGRSFEVERLFEACEPRLPDGECPGIPAPFEASSRRKADICASWVFSFSGINIDGPAAGWFMSPIPSSIADDRFDADFSPSGVPIITDRRNSRT